MIRSVYLAYPIDQAGPAHLVSFFEKINQFKDLATRKHLSWCFDPGDAFMVNPRMGIDPGLATINRAALINAQGLVAFLPSGVPTVGVPIEIDRARAMGKPVLVVTDVDSYMLELPGVDRIGLDTPIETLVDWCGVVEPYTERRTVGFMPTLLDQGGLLPTRGYPDDAGLDLYVSDNVRIAPHQFMDVPCGISVQLPERRWAMIVGRSSTLRKKGLLVHPGIIDTGYRGPLFAGVWNTTDESVNIDRGDRIAQMLMFYNETMQWHPEEVEDLEPSQRGTAGFGSTGT